MKKSIRQGLCSLLLITCFSGCGTTQTESESQVTVSQEEFTSPETPQEALEYLVTNNQLHRVRVVKGL